MTPNRTSPLARAGLAAMVLAVAGCAGLRPAEDAGATAAATETAAPRPVELGSYFDMLDRMAPGDAARQATELQSTYDLALQEPTASNRLRYAIALGAAGHVDSNPVEARRQLSDLLAGSNDLQPRERSLANAFLREFDARVALYADLARQREESERRLQSLDADGDRRYAALNAETQRLRKALAEAESKLEAVAEMERALTPEGQ
jgi:hypothetical protein